MPGKKRLNNQSGFAIFTGQKLHGDQLVAKAQAYIESQSHEKISMEFVSSKFSVGRRNLTGGLSKPPVVRRLNMRKRLKLKRRKRRLKALVKW